TTQKKKGRSSTPKPAGERGAKKSIKQALQEQLDERKAEQARQNEPFTIVSMDIGSAILKMFPEMWAMLSEDQKQSMLRNYVKDDEVIKGLINDPHKVAHSAVFGLLMNPTSPLHQAREIRESQTRLKLQMVVEKAASASDVAAAQAASGVVPAPTANGAAHA